MKPRLSIIALTLCSGCATNSFTQQTTIHFFKRSFYPDIALTALARGKLFVRNGCVRLVGTDGDDGMLVIWPKDSRLISEGDHQIIIVGGSDQRLRVGSQVQLGGGGSDSVEYEGLTASLPAGCGGPYF